jgi:hypothetical protein
MGGRIHHVTVSDTTNAKSQHHKKILSYKNVFLVSMIKPLGSSND